MLETLTEAFKEAFNEESRAAWNKIIDAIAKYMLKGIAKAKEQASIEDKSAESNFITDNASGDSNEAQEND